MQSGNWVGAHTARPGDSDTHTEELDGLRFFLLAGEGADVWRDVAQTCWVVYEEQHPPAALAGSVDAPSVNAGSLTVETSFSRIFATSVRHALSMLMLSLADVSNLSMDGIGAGVRGLGRDREGTGEKRRGPGRDRGGTGERLGRDWRGTGEGLGRADGDGDGRQGPCSKQGGGMHIPSDEALVLAVLVHLVGVLDEALLGQVALCAFGQAVGGRSQGLV